MRGKVKWFSQEKGYGYIVADDGAEHSFNIRDIKGAALPRNGDFVTFESSQGRKSLKASAITILPKVAVPAANHRSPDDRVTCTNCRKKMVPRIITGRPTFGGTSEPKKSVCPFCGHTHLEFDNGWCFIATAVYGNYDAPEVIALRRFRDQTLQQSAAGRIFIAGYYRLSPPIANIIKRQPILATVIRPILNRFARRFQCH